MLQRYGNKMKIFLQINLQIGQLCRNYEANNPLCYNILVYKTNAKAKLPNLKTKDVLLPCMGYQQRQCLQEYHVLPLILHR